MHSASDESSSKNQAGFTVYQIRNTARYPQTKSVKPAEPTVCFTLFIYDSMHVINKLYHSDCTLLRIDIRFLLSNFLPGITAEMPSVLSDTPQAASRNVSEKPSQNCGCPEIRSLTQSHQPEAVYSSKAGTRPVFANPAHMSYN